MNIDVARHIARAVFRSSREIGDLIPFLKDHLSDEEYRDYTKAIATATASIQLEVMNKVISDAPELKREIEGAIEKFGRFL